MYKHSTGEGSIKVARLGPKASKVRNPSLCQSVLWSCGGEATYLSLALGNEEGPVLPGRLAPVGGPSQRIIPPRKL